MAVTFTAAGSSALVTEGSTGSPNPGLPSSPQDGDLFLLFVTSRDNVSHTVTAAWAQAFQSSNGASTQVSVWYAWYKGTSPNATNHEVNAAPTVTHSGTHACCARVAGFRGAIASGAAVNPIDVISGAVSATGTSVSTAGITPTFDTGLVVHFFGAGTANTANALSGASGITTACLAATNTASGTGRACMGAYYKAATLAPVATGTAAVTCSASPTTATGWAGIQLVIKPKYASAGTGACHVRQVISSENTATGTTLTAVMPAAVLAGSYLVAVGGYFNTGQTMNVADNVNAGNYTKLDDCNDAINGHAFSIYGKAASGAGTPTATLTIGTTQTFRSLLFMEIANVSASVPLTAHLPNYQSSCPTSTDGVTSGTMTSSAGNKLFVGVTQAPGIGTAPSLGTGFTSLAANYGPNTAWGTAEAIYYTDGANHAVTFTSGSAGPTETFGLIFAELGSAAVYTTTVSSTATGSTAQTQGVKHNGKIDVAATATASTAQTQTIRHGYPTVASVTATTSTQTTAAVKHNGKIAVTGTGTTSPATDVTIRGARRINVNSTGTTSTQTDATIRGAHRINVTSTGTAITQTDATTKHNGRIGVTSTGTTSTAADQTLKHSSRLGAAGVATGSTWATVDTRHTSRVAAAATATDSPASSVGLLHSIRLQPISTDTNSPGESVTIRGARKVVVTSTAGDTAWSVQTINHTAAGAHSLTAQVTSTSSPFQSVSILGSRRIGTLETDTLAAFVDAAIRHASRIGAIDTETQTGFDSADISHNTGVQWVINAVDTGTSSLFQALELLSNHRTEAAETSCLSTWATARVWSSAPRIILDTNQRMSRAQWASGDAVSSRARWAQSDMRVEPTEPTGAENSTSIVRCSISDGKASRADITLSDSEVSK
jgi:hypothetical protein